MISTRTVAALAAAKQRGVKLGSPKGNLIQQDRAMTFAKSLRAIVAPVMHCSSREIATYLNHQGVKTQTGGAWQSATVLRLIERLKETA